MKRIIELTSQPSHYTAKACIVWCFDDRFSGLLKKFLEHRMFEHFDLVRIAGGAKALADAGGSDKDFVMKQITTSMKLHKTERVILMGHEQCGADGGVLSDEEKARQIIAAAAYVQSSLGENSEHIQVEAYLAKFDGLYYLDLK